MIWQTGVIRCDDRQGWGAASGVSEMATHTHTHRADQFPDRVDDLCEECSCAGSGACSPSTAAGDSQTEANSCCVMPFTSFASGCNLSYGAIIIPQSLVLCWLGGVHVCYICAGVYLFVRACVCVNVPVWECVRERTGEKESVAMHFYTSSHWSLHMKHHGRKELNTYGWAIFLWCNNTLAVKAVKAST